MVTGLNDVDEIYHRMAMIRRDHHTNVSESVAGAEALVDWGRYKWTYPWIAPAAAAAVGYLIYTNGHQIITADTASLTDGAKAGEPVAGARVTGQERSRTRQIILPAAWGILHAVAVAAWQSYALHWLRQFYPSKMVDQTGLSPSAGERGGRMGQAKQ